MERLKGEEGRSELKEREERRGESYSSGRRGQIPGQAKQRRNFDLCSDAHRVRYWTGQSAEKNARKAGLFSNSGPISRGNSYASHLCARSRQRRRRRLSVNFQSRLVSPLARLSHGALARLHRRRCRSLPEVEQRRFARSFAVRPSETRRTLRAGLTRSHT